METKNSRSSQGITAAELAKNRDAIARLAQSSDARKLMALLKQQSGGVQEAAQAAPYLLGRRRRGTPAG